MNFAVVLHARTAACAGERNDETIDSTVFRGRKITC